MVIQGGHIGKTQGTKDVKIPSQEPHSSLVTHHFPGGKLCVLTLPALCGV